MGAMGAMGAMGVVGISADTALDAGLAGVTGLLLGMMLNLPAGAGLDAKAVEGGLGCADWASFCFSSGLSA